MRQDWIEFKGATGLKCSLRPYNIVSLVESNPSTLIAYNCGGETVNLDINEPYEQVKQKIMDAEKVELSDVVVEHFTREEYMYILKILNDHLEELEKVKSIDAINPSSLVNQLRYKINEILEEEE